MKNFNLITFFNSIEIGDELVIQEPSQIFSADCYIYNGREKNYLKLIQCNGDENEGIEIKFPIALFVKCDVTIF